jgi:hypothetical protein
MFHRCVKLFVFPFCLQQSVNIFGQETDLHLWRF